MKTLVCAAVAFSVVLSAAAASLDRELVQDAEAIVVARVASARGYYGFDGRIRTRATLDVEATIKGGVPTRLEIDELGGTVGPITLAVPERPTWITGQHAVVFLVRHGGFWTTARGAAGKFDISGDTLLSANGRSTWLQADVLSFIAAARSSTFAKPPRPLAVPSRYLITQTKPSANGSETKPVRWPSFGTGLVFRAAGAQPGLGDGGTSALQDALAAWSGAPASSVRLTYGGTTTATNAAQDGVNSVVFNDPNGAISGSYTAEQFTGAGTLASPRVRHTATLLGDGSVLIAGGAGASGTLNSAEIYSGGASTALPATLSARESHAAVLLPDGTVLLAGGTSGGAYLNSAQLFDPLSKTFSDTGSTLSAPRAAHTATLLGASGDVLVAGGRNAGGVLGSAELYQSSTGQFSTTGAMTTPRVQHTATGLADGRVLIAGGSDGTHALNTAEIYDPVAKTFAATAGTMTVARANAAAVLIDDVSGQVLISGGTDGTNTLDTAEIFDPTAGTFSAVVTPMSSKRQGHAAIRLSSNAVLIAGGSNGTTALNTVEVFEAAPPSLAPRSATMSVGRTEFTATRLNGGGVLFAGGAGTAGSSFEKYVFPTNETLGLTQLWLDGSSHDYAGLSFFSIIEADVVLQDGLTAPGLTNGGLARLIGEQIGTALGFAQTSESSLLNPNFDFNAPPFAAALQAYDAEAAAAVYPGTTTAQKGDANGDTAINAADVMYVLNYLFKGGSAPVGSADVNGDGKVDVADVFYLINYIFAGGPAPR